MDDVKVVWSTCSSSSKDFEDIQYGSYTLVCSKPGLCTHCMRVYSVAEFIYLYNRGLIHKEGEREREREIDEDIQDLFVFREFFTLCSKPGLLFFRAHTCMGVYEVAGFNRGLIHTHIYGERERERERERE